MDRSEVSNVTLAEAYRRGWELAGELGLAEIYTSFACCYLDPGYQHCNGELHEAAVSGFRARVAELLRV
jgi:hypothetical protein